MTMESSRRCFNTTNTPQIVARPNEQLAKAYETGRATVLGAAIAEYLKGYDPAVAHLHLAEEILLITTQARQSHKTKPTYRGK